MAFVEKRNGYTDRFFVVLAPSEARFGTLRERAESLVSRYGGELIFLYDPLMEAFAVKVNFEAAKRLARDREVSMVEQDQPLLPLLSVSEELRRNPRNANRIFQTPGWALDRIDQEKPPLNKTYDPPNSAAGVSVYIVDSGVNDPGGFHFGKTRLKPGFSYDGGGTSDQVDHGTAVAAIIGSAFFGVAPQSLIVPVRVANPGSPEGTCSIAAGVVWAVQDARGKSAVINISVTVEESECLNAIVGAAAATVTCVVAAGNKEQDASYYSPGGAPSVITVAASTIDAMEEREFIWRSSNYGSSVSILAPGERISSISNTGFPCETLYGTSFAAPFVSGAAAIYLYANPGSSASDVKNAIINNSSTCLILNLPAGTPNRLLWIR